MQSRSFPVKLALSAALLIWLIAALLDSVLLDRGSFVDALVLSVPPAEWLLRAIILVLLLVVAIVIAGRTSGLSDEDSVVAEEGPGIDYAGIALSAEVIMISLDREGRITLFNRRCEAITGYRSEEMLGLNFFDELLPPRALPSMLPAFEAILAGGESVRRELPWVTGRGQEVIIGAWTSAVRDDEGGITGVVMVGEEVTEYRLSDAELLLSREPWRPLAETMFGDGLAAVDADGVLTWVSSTLAEMLGRERSDLSGSQLAEIAAVEDRETVTMKLAECLRAGAPERAEFTAAPAHAPPFPAALALSPVAPEDGASSVALAVIRDMSDIKAAEADFLTARAEAQEQLRRLEDELSERDRDTSRAVDAIRAEHAEEIERMRLQMEAAHERVEQVRRSEREQADAGLTELRARLEAAEAAAAKARDAADAETAEAERLRRELEASAAEVEGLRGHELVKQQERIAQLTEELEAAEERVRQAREAALAEQQQRVDALSAELEAERERARVIEDDAAHRAEEAREAALAEQQQRIDALTAQVAEAERLGEEAQEAARQEFAAEHERLSAELEAERERARVIEDDAAHRAEEAREAALAEQQTRIDALTAAVVEAQRLAEEAQEAARQEFAAEHERLSAELEAERERARVIEDDAAHRAEEAREAALAEQQQRIDALTAQVAEAKRTADQAQEAARQEFAAEHERLSAELEAERERARVIEDDAARRAEEARRAAIAEQQQRIDALTAQVAEAERLAEEAQEAARQEFAAEHERLSAELEAERERARVIEDDAAHLAEAAREAALAEQQIARLTAQLDEAAAQVERAREQARAQLAGMLAGMSAKIADIEQAAHHEHEEALAERQEQIETLEARLRDAEERAAQARLLAREEYEGEIATSLAEAAAVEERIAQAKAEAQEQYQAEIDRLAQELDAAINGAGEDGVRLAESLGFLQSLLDGIPYPVFFTDRDGRYQSCNTAFARRIVGMPRQDLLGLSFDDLRGRIPGELMEALRRGERDVLTEGVEEAYEVRVPISGGQQRTFAFRKEPCLDHEGQIVGVIGAMLDLSGLEEAQQSLEEERQHCATVLERVPAVVAEIKPDGRTVAVHGDCRKLLGYEREQLIGRDWWETLFPGHLQEPIRDVVGAMRSGADLDDRALVMRTADGEERTLSWTTSNARNDRRELVSILAVAVDITERAETEEALQLSYREALERIKKLRCLGNVLRLTQDESLSLVEVISGIATSLPEAWGYPGITTSRISVYKRERRGGESPYPVVAFQSAPIMVSGEKVGEVQVCYHEDRPERFDGPFTADERELLDVIARRISEMIERRSAEESLAKLRLFRHNLIEQANLWVMALDRDRNVVLWNRVAEEISGYSRGEVVGHDRVWELLYPDRGYRTEIIHGMTEVTFGAHIAEDWETIIRARDGTDRVISWHANRLMDDDGTTLGSVVFGRETSQRRAAASS